MAANYRYLAVTMAGSRQQRGKTRDDRRCKEAFGVKISEAEGQAVQIKARALPKHDVLYLLMVRKS